MRFIAIAAATLLVAAATTTAIPVNGPLEPATYNLVKFCEAKIPVGFRLLKGDAKRSKGAQDWIYDIRFKGASMRKAAEGTNSVNVFNIQAPKENKSEATLTVIPDAASTPAQPAPAPADLSIKIKVKDLGNDQTAHCTFTIGQSKFEISYFQTIYKLAVSRTDNGLTSKPVLDVLNGVLTINDALQAAGKLSPLQVEHVVVGAVVRCVAMHKWKIGEEKCAQS